MKIISHYQSLLCARIIPLLQSHVNKYIIYLNFEIIANENNSFPKVRRKKSKISIQFEEYENHKKEYDNLIKEELEEENDLIDTNFDDSENINDTNNKDNNDNNCFNNIKQFEIYFFLKLNNDIEYVFLIQSDYLNIKEKYGFELIKNIIQKINDKNIVVENNSVKYIVSLRDNDSEDEDSRDFYSKNYELKKCKKDTLKPKEDIPSFSPTSLLEEFINERISLVCNNDLNIMLTEKYNDYKETSEPKDEVIINNKNNSKGINVNSNNKKKRNKEKLYKTKCTII